jgi:hypothetical protein
MTKLLIWCGKLWKNDTKLTRREFLIYPIGLITMAKMISEHFSFDEMVCRCGDCKRADMDPEFVKLLEQIRKAYGKPMFLSSAFRCDNHNSKVSSVPNGPHTFQENGGLAVDVLIWGVEAKILFSVAQNVGASGLGVAQTGDIKDRFLHIDGVERAAGSSGFWNYPVRRKS